MALLQTVGTFLLAKNRLLRITQGSVLDFIPTDRIPPGRPTQPNAAIVNAANPGCLKGGGVDGAITNAGGPNLRADRLALPVVLWSEVGEAIRCPVGSSVLTGPNDYGDLAVPFVIHAVGPNFWDYASHEMDEAFTLLDNAYTSTLQLAEQHQLTEVAFSLLSAGVYRGECDLADVLHTGVLALRQWSETNDFATLGKIHLCAFTKDECDVLMTICHKLLQPA